MKLGCYHWCLNQKLEEMGDENNSDVYLLPWDHDQPTESIHMGSAGNQEQPKNDLNMLNALHCASSRKRGKTNQKA